MCFKLTEACNTFSDDICPCWQVPWTSVTEAGQSSVPPATVDCLSHGLTVCVTGLIKSVTVLMALCCHDDRESVALAVAALAVSVIHQVEPLHSGSDWGTVCVCVFIPHSSQLVLCLWSCPQCHHSVIGFWNAPCQPEGCTCVTPD